MAYSSLSDLQSIQQILQSGADDFICKEDLSVNLKDALVKICENLTKSGLYGCKDGNCVVVSG